MRGRAVERIEMSYGIFQGEGVVFEKREDGVYFESNIGNTFRKLECVEEPNVNFPETSEGYGIYGD